MFLHLAGLFRGARRYEVASLSAGDHDLDIAIGKQIIYINVKQCIAEMIILRQPGDLQVEEHRPPPV